MPPFREIIEQKPDRFRDALAVLPVFWPQTAALYKRLGVERVDRHVHYAKHAVPLMLAIAAHPLPQRFRVTCQLVPLHDPPASVTGIGRRADSYADVLDSKKTILVIG